MTTPVEINPTLLYKAASGGYQIPRSLRFRSSAPNYLTRLPPSAGNQQKWTLSFWVKRGKLGNYNIMFNNNAYSGTYIAFGGAVADTLMIGDYGSGYNYQLVTTQVFRDTSAWYHFVIAFDTTQATAANRVKVYCNGSQITSFQTATYPTQNYNTYWNQTSTHYIGQASDGSPFDGYMTEINFINGSQLDQTSFGQTDTTTGVWTPKKYTGSYGTNGFYLNFSDNSAATAAAIGKDSSGNGNNFTPNNISLTAGVTYDSMIDTPTPYDDGGNGRGNYATLNPLATSGGTFSNGNLQYIGPAGLRWAFSTIEIPSSVNVYAEATLLASAQNNSDANTYASFGVVPVGFSSTSGSLTTGGLWVNDTGFIHNNNATGTNIGSAFVAGDVIGLAFNPSTGAYTFYKNGTSVSTGTLSLSGPFYFANFSYSNQYGQMAVNFGQRPFAYTPPSGFKALNTQNLPEPAIKKGSSYFNTVLYTGNGASRSITGVGFQPDLVWIKKRDTATSGDHNLFDALRGTTKYLNTNNTGAEGTDAQSLTAFGTDGFSLGTGANVNFNGNTFVGWSWKEGATPGFDIVTYTGDGTNNKSINHNLGVTPRFYLVKNRSASGNWVARTNVTGAWQFAQLNTTATFQNTIGVNTPTSTTFGIYGPSDNINGNNYVAYLFAGVEGFSKFGSYTGNGSTDGPFVYCGFRPRFIMIKNSTTTSPAANWNIIDTARNGSNVSTAYLEPNTSSAEGSYGGWDILSNGFKLRNTGESLNQSNVTYIFAAFAENPFKYALAR